MGRLDALEIKEFIKHSAQKPQDRLHFTTSSVGNNFGRGNPMLKELGITADCKPLQIEGRVLPQPIIKMGTKTAPISQGAWRINQYHMSVPLQNWAVLDLCSFRGNEIRTFVDTLIQSARRKAFNIAPPEIIPFNTNGTGSFPVKVLYCVVILYCDMIRYCDVMIYIIIVIYGIVIHSNKYSDMLYCDVFKQIL